MKPSPDPLVGPLDSLIAGRRKRGGRSRAGTEENSPAQGRLNGRLIVDEDRAAHRFYRRGEAGGFFEGSRIPLSVIQSVSRSGHFFSVSSGVR